MEELIAFLPRLYAKGFAPIKEWAGGITDQRGTYTLPWPRYEAVVEEFFRIASRDCWTDYGYSPDMAARLLTNEDAVKAADLPQIRAMLTYCVRGERFCEGHWNAMIESGNIRRLLARLAELASK